MRSFWNNEKARIPFSVIGVFLIIGSSVTATYISNLERDKSIEIASTLDINEIAEVLRFAQADIARSLNYAVMKALKQIGETPVTFSDLDTDVAKDYADNDPNDNVDIDIDKNDNDDGKINTLKESVAFNKNWAKNLARVDLNDYIKTNYMNDRFEFGDYIINVDSEILDWREISLTSIEMKFDRKVHVGCLINSPSNEKYETYWEASLDLQITIKDIETGQIEQFTITPLTIINSRFPLLMALTNTFESTISGKDSNDIISNKLMVLVTLISQIYTEARALLQFALGPSTISNIVGNKWLQYVTNACLTLEEFLVFNSVDPLGLIQLIIHTTDLAGDENSMLGGPMDSISFFDQDSGINADLWKRTNDEYNTGYTDKQLNNKVNKAKEMLNKEVKVHTAAEDILYNIIYTVHYHRVDDNNRPLDEFGNIVNDINDLGKIETDTKEYNTNQDKITFETKFVKNGKTFIIGHPEDNKAYDRSSPQGINKKVIEKIEIKLEEAYDGTVSIDIDRNIGPDKYNPAAPANYISKSEGDWAIVSKNCKNINNKWIGNGYTELPSTNYEETWEVTWEREVIFYTSCKSQDQFGNCISYNEVKCTQSQIHTINFDIDVKYLAGDVEGVFSETTIFGKADNNLKVVLEEYATEFKDNIRDSVLDSRTKDSEIDIQYQYPKNGVDFKVDFLKDSDGLVVKALEDVLQMIIDDKPLYETDKKNYDGSSKTISDMNVGMDVISGIFNDRKDDYLKADLYIDQQTGKFYSVGAKVIYNMRKWYIDEIGKALSSQSDTIKDTLNDHVGSDKMGAYEDIQNDKDFGGSLDSITNQGGIQLGLTSELIGDWNEKVSFAIDHQPKYFDCFDPDLKGSFKVTSVCLLGPTGLPLLPIPPIPWFCTINSWYIEIDGEYESYQVMDTYDECHADTLFAHTSQIYLRKFDTVEDPASNGEFIGITNRINFDFWTLNFAITPPGRLPIGDSVDMLYESKET